MTRARGWTLALAISLGMWALIIWGSCSVLAQTPFGLNPDMADYYDMAPPPPVGPRFVPPSSHGFTLSEMLAAAAKTYKEYRDKGKMK